uniref:Protein G12 n=1 Tax=Ceratitis capitata TaxID=7213 RepID=W8BYS8_CERCA
MKKLIIVFAGVVLLVQLAHSLPLVKRAAFARNGDSTEEFDGKQQLGIYVLGEVAKFAKFCLDKGSVVVNNAVKDLKAIPDNDELLLANITRMSKIGKEAADFELQDDEESVLKLLTLMGNFTDMMADYERMPENSKLRQTLQIALENNGSVKLENEMEDKIVALFKDFDIAFNEYLKTLSPIERLRQLKLIVWYEDFKTESQEEKKLEKFGQFFTLLD